MSAQELVQKPDIKLSVKQTFGFDSEMQVKAFSKKLKFPSKTEMLYRSWS